MPWKISNGTWEWSPPELTLGFGVCDWAEEHFTVPGGPMYGQPLELSGWQLQFLADWYSIDPMAPRYWKPGRPTPWMYRRALVRLAKKTGKSPIGGVITAASFCGPTVLDGFDAAGEPVGVPHQSPWIQIAAVSEDQTANTYSPFYTMMTESELPRVLNIDCGLAKTAYKDRPKSLVEVVTSSAGTREGQPITDCVADELQLWTPRNGGKKLHTTLRRNVAPMNGRLVCFCNAFEPGVQSEAEATEAASRSTPDILVYGPQYEMDVKDLEDTEALRRALHFVYRDAPWTDPDRIAKEVGDPDMPADEARRFYLNVPSAPDSVLCEWPQVTELSLEAGDPVAMGFDGSKNRDATAVVLIHMVTGNAYLWRYWERPPGLPVNSSWEVPRGEVNDAIEQVFALFTVARALCDPSHWRDELASWQHKHDREVISDFKVGTFSAVDAAVEATQEAMRLGQVKIDRSEDSADLRAHVARCRVVRRMVGSRTLRSLAKPEGGGRIDAAAALVYAQAARLDALSKGWAPQEELEPWVMTS